MTSYHRQSLPQQDLGSLSTDSVFVPYSIRFSFRLAKDLDGAGTFLVIGGSQAVGITVCTKHGFVVVGMNCLIIDIVGVSKSNVGLKSMILGHLCLQCTIPVEHTVMVDSSQVEPSSCMGFLQRIKSP